MVAIKAQVSIPYLTGVPSDVAVNVWSFEGVDDDEPTFSELGAFIFTFYNGIDQYMSPILDLSSSNLKFFVRSDAEPQAPRVDTTVNLGLGNTESALPEEVAACLSFRGTNLSGAPPARRRGRIYLGPLGDNTVTVGALGRVVVDPTFIGDVQDAVDAANAELVTAGNFHTVWSIANSANVTVATYWMDNAPDTQRRRGTDATNRTTWNL